MARGRLDLHVSWSRKSGSGLLKGSTGRDPIFVGSAGAHPPRAMTAGPDNRHDQRATGAEGAQMTLPLTRADHRAGRWVGPIKGMLNATSRARHDP